MSQATVTGQTSLINRPASTSLRRNFSWTVLGNVYYAICQWAVLAAIAKLGSTEMVGQYALAVAITAPIIMFSSLKLRAILASDAKQEYSFQEYLGVRLLTTPLAVLVILLIVAIGFRSQLGVVIILIGLSKAVEALSDLVYGLFQQREQMHLSAIAQIIKGSISIIAFTSGLAVTGNLAAASATTLVSWALVFLFFEVPCAMKVQRLGVDSNVTTAQVSFWFQLRPAWNGRRTVSLIWLGLPLGITIALGSLESVVPRYIVESVLGSQQLGIFAGMSYVLVAGGLVISALGQSATPRLSQYYSASAIGPFRSLLLRLVILGAGVGLAGIGLAVILGEWALRVLYNEDYAQRKELFVWITVAAAIGYCYVFLGTACSAMRMFRVQLPVHLATLVVVIALSWRLIPIYGLMGAIWAMILSGIVQAVLYVAVIYRSLKQSIEAVSMVSRQS